MLDFPLTLARFAFAEALVLLGLGLALFVVFFSLLFLEFPLVEEPPELLLALLLDVPFDLSAFAKAAPPRGVPFTSGIKGGASRSAVAARTTDIFLLEHKANDN